jgi:hypothetical protein
MANVEVSPDVVERLRERVRNAEANSRPTLDISPALLLALLERWD